MWSCIKSHDFFLLPSPLKSRTQGMGLPLSTIMVSTSHTKRNRKIATTPCSFFVPSDYNCLHELALSSPIYRCLPILCTCWIKPGLYHVSLGDVKLWFMLQGREHSERGNDAREQRGVVAWCGGSSVAALGSRWNRASGDAGSMK